ncbi:OTU domain-containing protein [Psidium guajava]|nr:OTU domain-containing protein [Psidium guajava]
MNAIPVRQGIPRDFVTETQSFPDPHARGGVFVRVKTTVLVDVGHVPWQRHLYIAWMYRRGDMLLGPLQGFEVPLQYLVPWDPARDIPNEGEVSSVGEEGSGEHSEGSAPMEIEGSTDNSQENLPLSSGESDPKELPSTEVSGTSNNGSDADE